MATDAFPGFGIPESNYFRLPNDWTDITAGIKTVAELKIVEYVLRHTWGYQEYGISKHITVDEFQHGRKRADGTRIDRGTGLSEQSVRNGIETAITNGFVEEQVDESDRARVKKSYGLKMAEGVKTLGSGAQTLDPEVQSLEDGGLILIPRTEKDTKERNQRKKYTYVQDPVLIPFEQLNGLRAVAESLDFTEITAKDVQRLEQIVHDPECDNTVCEAIGADYMVYVYDLPESKRPKDIIRGFRYQVKLKCHWAQYQKNSPQNRTSSNGKTFRRDTQIGPADGSHRVPLAAQERTRANIAKLAADYEARHGGPSAAAQ